MKKSKYNLSFSKDGYNLIFNTAKCSIVILDDVEYTKFCSMQLDSDSVNQLKELGMIVNDDADETAIFFTKYRQNFDKNNVFFRIYTTTCCNAKCPYCYQKGIKAITMTKEIADKVVEYILANTMENKKLHIEWFGGEPLCNNYIISYISQKISSALQGKNIEYYSTIITNGYLFDEKLVSTAKNIWKLKDAQITLDGLDEYYESVKRFGDKNSFKKVVNNIKLLADNDIVVRIRINYSKENLVEIKKLLDYLSINFKNNKNVWVYGHAIFDKLNKLNIQEMEELDVEFFEYMIKAGFKNRTLNSIAPNYNRCFAHSLHSALIYCDGTLFKCPQQIEKNQDAVGDIFSGVDIEKISKWCSTQLPEKCEKCVYLPICNGGCISVRNYGKKACKYSQTIMQKLMSNSLQDFISNKNLI